ncbi:alpha/beta hydrolase [Aerosakkonemataceae cyanobacterium BLCC-F154]|uniref:Alpha/beta hydrolase n=1 Tax=Floridaenema fluviatile BLCC-F154 TaxID=3153640 RepID=A0ABV4YKR8_9CYAN
MFFNYQTASNWLGKIQLLLLGIGASAIATLPAKAAETIYFQYGSLVQSLQVSSLETFAETGVVPPDLQFYFNFLKADKQEQERFRQLLNSSMKVNLVPISQFLYTGMGEGLLKQFGSYIRTDPNINGKYALRAAIILAASDPKGLSLLNLFRKYPTNMWIDVQASLNLSKAAGIVVEATQYFTKTVTQLSEEEAKKEVGTNFSALPDLRKSGNLGIVKKRWQLQDRKRQRSFYVDLYQPQSWRTGKTPIIVLSHGLGSRPEDLAERAEYLTSHGYFVAIPQHPGSDMIQLQNMQQGLSRNVLLTQEFIDTPLDISYVLDELERRNQSEFSGRLNVQSVGVMGHSFGGYTVLAVAGATIDFANLQKDCNNNLNYLDLSLLVQCRVLDLPPQAYNLRDPRVKAVYALNPVNNSVFGAKGLSQITIPTMLEAGTYDPATPAVFEQVRSFKMLTTPNKYLALIEGQAHVDFSVLGSGLMQLVESVTKLTLPPPKLLDSYSNALTLAFFEVYLQNDETYRPYLQAAYTEYLSRDRQFKVFLISAKSDKGLGEASREFRAKL